MNESYKVVCMWADESITIEYEGKWWSQAHDNGERALENGAIMCELQTLQSGDVVSSIEIAHPAFAQVPE